MDIVLAFLGILFVLAGLFVQIGHLISDVSRLEETVADLEKRVGPAGSPVSVKKMLFESGCCQGADDA